jgi:hypothetical protein
VRCAWLAACAATDLWDDVNWDVVTRRHLDGIRRVGALSVLPLSLNSRAIYLLLSGDLAEAESLVAETAWLAEITAGQNAMLPYGDVCLSAMRGDASRAEPQMNRLLDEIAMRGEGVGLNMVSWFQAMLYNGVGRFADAMSAAQVAAAAPLELGPPKWALGELIEAAVHSGSADAAASAFEQLSGFAQASGTELALGIEAGHKALLCSGPAAEAIVRRSRGSKAPRSEWSWRAPNCASANGFGARAGARMLAISCGRRTRHFRLWASVVSPRVPEGNLLQPVRV